jgi:hypothetical protein
MFPLLGRRFLIMQQLDYNSGRAVFSIVVRAERLLERRGFEHSQLIVSSIQESVRRGLELEEEE